MPLTFPRPTRVRPGRFVSTTASKTIHGASVGEEKSYFNISKVGGPHFPEGQPDPGFRGPEAMRGVPRSGLWSEAEIASSGRAASGSRSGGGRGGGGGAAGGRMGGWLYSPENFLTPYFIGLLGDYH